MSKSCCNHQHAAAPIKAVNKADAGQTQHRHDNHCCDQVAPVSACASPAPHETQANDSPGDDEPPRGGCHGQGCCSPSPSHDHEHEHEHEHEHHAHAEAAEASEPLGAPEQHSRRHSWQVLGMDCPSCARKIETAVSRVPGVQQARVLFATEKLVVDLAPELSPDPVTAAVLAAGFRLKGETRGKAAETRRSPVMSLLGNLFGKYGQPLSLAALMLVAALLPAQIGQPLFILATLWGLWPVARKAWALTRSGSPFAIETLMTVAALGALFLGETAEAAMVLLLFMLGEHLEAYAAGRARAGVTALMALVPDKALRIRTVLQGQAQSEVREEVAADELRPGDIIEIAPGARLPADARLLDALGAFDESALTGESIPVERRQGDKVPAGSLAADRVLRLEVVSEPGNNAIDRILHLIEEAETQRAPIERFIDRFSRWYTPAMMLVALLVVIVPPLAFGQSWDEWIYRGLALLLIGCPCALVISTPAAVTSALAAATRQGALIKGGAALERLAHVDTVAFDKTGTLTLGKPQLTELISLDGRPEAELLALAAAIEQGSHHPLAKAVVAAASEQGLTLAAASELRALPGMGVEGRIDGALWQLLAPSRIPSLDEAINQRVSRLEAQGKTVVVLCQAPSPHPLPEGEGTALTTPVALLALRDQIRPDAAAALQELRALGLQSIMLTGDNPRAAEAIATELGMGWRASLLPEGKVEEIAKLAEHRKVAMIGDGINDAPAMKRASIGIAMGGGTDVALETADAALTHNQLGGLAAMIRLSRSALANIHQNIALALGLKAIFLVTSLLGITGLWIAVLADTGATALVTANALRLLRKR
ncbi:zinc/cadmium/mercury/lead-transporting ATPase [Aeromonas sp. sif2416]|uniref:zinc/cadmium/mercury/lead-transporting ATPase n=1 Tax=Aeromonas sp. sif2416 TaxID=2854793 RepID=UPI001C45CD9A|nr:zinc/cadmium/mercury/lead-transporting ATPase [Aeromonas sp. sif2416]MBV7439097.1 zinc/cadmium/mercury/lead-transporting ATPase [Aeromonas sp. sif2416]